MGTVPSPTSRLVLSRRAILGAGAGSLGLLAVRPAAAALPSQPRHLTFQNLHTGESLKSDYWVNGSYQPDALAQIAHVLRDHRTNTVHPINPNLLDLLTHLHDRLGTKSAFQVISGYRSPQSNAQLAERSNGVAHNSLHMQGMAIDIRVPGVELKTLHRAAKSLVPGGVG